MCIKNRRSKEEGPVKRALFFILMVVLCEGAGRPWAAEGSSLAQGRQVYLTHCAVCHGERGDGQGPGAARLQTKPRDFTSGLFKFRSTPSGALPLDRDLYRTLREGVHRTSMIPQTHLSADDRWAAIQYIKGFSVRFVRENPAEPVRLPPLPTDLRARREQGKQLYVDAGCVQCHGPAGRGNGSAAQDLLDAWGHPIRPTDLTLRPLKGGSSPTDLYRTLSTGLNGTPMPSYHDALSEEERWALVAYVESLATSERQVARGMMGMMGPGEEPIGRMIEMMNRMGMQGAGCVMQ
jgi:mono/diheme cytochrome c family protein